MDLNHRSPPYKGGALTTKLYAPHLERINENSILFFRCAIDPEKLLSIFSLRLASFSET